MADLTQLADQLVNLTVKEVKELTDILKDQYGIEPAAAGAVVVAGGGAALLYASQKLKRKSAGHEVLLSAIRAPFQTILDNAGIVIEGFVAKPGMGIDATTGKKVNMIKAGIIDPVLVTKTALKNAVSVATTIVSADCIISNMRMGNASN